MKTMKTPIFFAALMTSFAVAGCSPRPQPPPTPPAVPLHLEPACDLAPSAGLEWIVEAKPRAIAEIPDLIPSIGLVLGEDRLKLFAAAHGGIDLRQIKDLCIAHYEESVLQVAYVPLDGERVAAAFESRATRDVKRTLLAPNPRVLRLSGSDPEQLLVFGHDAVALEQGKTGPIRAAEAFAFGKLKRASPALRGAALQRASQVLGEAPLRVFAPGPFSGETANALGGLLRAATAIGASARWKGTKAHLEIRVVLTGAWGDDAPVASERFGAAVHVISESSAGRLFGLDHPVVIPTVRFEKDALVLDATIDGAALAKGIHDAVDAEVGEIMRK